jgi:hypothetical protein
MVPVYNCNWSDDLDKVGCMRFLSRSYILFSLFFLALTACANAAKLAKPTPAPDSDAANLITMGQQALQIAQKEASQVALRQVDTDLSVTDFRFVDSALTKEIMVVVPAPGAPLGQWYSVDNSVSPLLTPAGMTIDLQGLAVGPARVARAMTAHWPGCTIRGITLYHENDGLTWVAFCNTPEGVASGSMDNQTGVFQPSNAPPAPVPVTATPSSASVRSRDSFGSKNRFAFLTRLR